MARILVIDDEEIIQDVIQNILEQQGHEILLAENGQKALDIFKSEAIDLVITDIMMPEKDGFETIQELKEHQSNVKIIALTGYGLHNLPVAFDLGAARIFEKPVKPEELREAVTNLLAE